MLNVFFAPCVVTAAAVALVGLATDTIACLDDAWWLFKKHHSNAMAIEALKAPAAELTAKDTPAL